MRPTDPDIPMSMAILFLRFYNNIYIIFMNIHPSLFPRVCHAAKQFLHCLYRVPLKWEPTEVRVSWGRTLRTLRTLSPEIVFADSDFPGIDSQGGQTSRGSQRLGSGLILMM